MPLIAEISSGSGQFLPIPQNYYGDLEANGLIDGAALEELAKAGLMFDRDRSGQFRHAYATPFEGRFFFEFLEPPVSASCPPAGAHSTPRPRTGGVRPMS